MNRNLPASATNSRRRKRNPDEKPDWLCRRDIRLSRPLRLGLFMVHGVDMAAVDVIVENLVALWRLPAIRKNFPWLFLLLSLVGSLLKELELVPQTYFSSSRNVLNV